ncbi:MAG: glycosyltransferase [Anaerolineales bacterium]|nr:glycosyltransferase [Anaerolineales bacterium]
MSNRAARRDAFRVFIPAFSRWKFRIVSCSRVVPVKRVGLLLEAVSAAARIRPDLRFIWHHIGNGDTREELQKYANKAFPENASAVFSSYIDRQNLFELYRQTPVDIFVNVSESEGTPVTAMEAISCGIPILATAVGGNVEIDTKQNGWLLSPNPTPEEIATALISIHDNVVDTGRKEKRKFPSLAGKI